MAELAILKDGATVHLEPLHEARWWESEPGRKWFSGFFSMGSTCSAAGEP